MVYLGMLKELAGREQELVHLDEGAHLHDLYHDLQARRPALRSFQKAIALAVNYEYSDGAAELHENDEVALIPPVSGGTEEDRSSVQQAAPLVSEHASLVYAPIDQETISRSIKHPADGALATFDGIVRDNSRGRKTLYLDYSAYEPMALRQLEELAREAVAEFAVRDVNIVHRLGTLQIGETSVYIAVASAHRAAAFEACRWLIDTLKRTVPIWKKEYFEDGAVWADGEPFPSTIPVTGDSASK